MSDWVAVDVTAETASAEAVESALLQVGASGTAIDSLGRSVDSPRLIVTGFFAESVSLEDVEDAIGTELRITDNERSSIKDITFRKVENADWLAEWKKHWRPTESGRFVVAPPWASVDAKDKLVIRIEPNMAFGTGTHETTQLCLEALSEIVTAGMTVIDVGTGTGVLAIAAAKLGCKHVRAYDTDADSVNIAELNAEANGVIDSIFFYEGTLTPSADPADLIVANLTLDVIKPMLPTLIEKADIRLLLSGILVTQEAEIVEALHCCEIADAKVTRKGEWIAVSIGT